MKQTEKEIRIARAAAMARELKITLGRQGANPGYGQDWQNILKTEKVAADEVRQEIARQKMAHSERYPGMWTYCKTHTCNRTKTLSFHIGNVHEHLRSVRVEAVHKSINRALRDYSNITVAFTSNPAAVGALATDDDLGAYSNSCTYHKIAHNLHMIVPELWRTRVDRKGLAIIDGMMTLDAQPLDAKGDIELYAAVWVQRGRGYAVNAQTGYIAYHRESHTAFHAKTAQGAAVGVSRKRSLTAEQRKEMGRKLQVGLLKKSIMELGGGENVLVTYADARAVHACDYGIRNWCNITSIDYGAGQAPLGAVITAYIECPLPEARAAILHAVRRVRSTR